MFFDDKIKIIHWLSNVLISGRESVNILLWCLKSWFQFSAFQCWLASTAKLCCRRNSRWCLWCLLVCLLLDVSRSVCWQFSGRIRCQSQWRSTMFGSNCMERCWHFDCVAFLDFLCVDLPSSRAQQLFLSFLDSSSSWKLDESAGKSSVHWQRGKVSAKLSPEWKSRSWRLSCV